MEPRPPLRVPGPVRPDRAESRPGSKAEACAKRGLSTLLKPDTPFNYRLPDAIVIMIIAVWQC